MKVWLISLLPPAVWQRIREPLKRFIANFKNSVVSIFAINGFFASIYYTFFNRSFYREHRSVILGTVAYDSTLKHLKRSSALLRRNIHRLEKGIIMRPRRPVFAEDYIIETLSVYILASTTPRFCQDELCWAYAVLTEYFAVVKDSYVITRARAQFLALPPVNLKVCETSPEAININCFTVFEPLPILTPACDSVRNLSVNGERIKPVPYLHKNLPEPAVSYSQLVSLFTRRRSVRWYLPKPVPADLIEQAVAAASLAPSACNRQPYQFIVLNDREKATAAAKCAMGTVGFAENIPCLLVVTGDLSAYPAERDRHVIYIDASLASMQLMLALETLGLSSCPINWPDIEEREQQLNKLLHLPYHQRVIMLMAVGYADPEGGIAYSQKKPTSLLIKEDSANVNRN